MFSRYARQIPPFAAGVLVGGVLMLSVGALALPVLSGDAGTVTLKPNDTVRVVCDGNPGRISSSGMANFVSVTCR